MTNNQQLCVFRLKQVEKFLGLKKTKIYQLVKAGELVAPIKLGSGRAVGWLYSDLTNFVERQVAASRR